VGAGKTSRDSNKSLIFFRGGTDTRYTEHQDPIYDTAKVTHSNAIVYSIISSKPHHSHTFSSQTSYFHTSRQSTLGPPRLRPAIRPQKVSSGEAILHPLHTASNQTAYYMPSAHMPPTHSHRLNITLDPQHRKRNSNARLERLLIRTETRCDAIPETGMRASLALAPMVSASVSTGDVEFVVVRVVAALTRQFLRFPPNDMRIFNQAV